MSETPRPWLECVDLHPDVLSEEFSEDVFALDLGALADYLIGKDLGVPASELPRVPAVYRDADSFFGASYLTSGLKSLLEDVLGRLAGSRGNRVLKLLTPFGGGKSHTLAALLHGARSRAALDALPEAAGLPRPEQVRVAVVDGQFFDAQVGKRVPAEGFAAKTLWGWIAWALGGPEGYELVREQDDARVAPGGDQIIELLKRGPSLILLDEVLEYLISAGGVRVEQTTLRDETLSFLKRLTVAVGNVDDAVLVYSLQSSNRESLEYTSLLRTVEHLAARKDQRREPVEGNEILNVIQRRLLAKTPDRDVAGSVAEACGHVISAGGVRVEQTTLRDETLSFLKRLTVAVGNVDDAVLVYSLQSSNRESLEYTSLLRTVEHLAARKDQRREPVEGNEILNVIQRRLLAKTPDRDVAGSVAEACGHVFTQMRRAWAQGEPERRQAEEDGLALRDRIKSSYPFHPALIDVMRERWAAIPDFQRTRGALRFLASCLRAAHRAGGSRPLLGPGDVPVHDADVRLAFFKEVGQREDFQACLEHDFVGANARTRRIDARRAREVTSEAGKQPATRLATCMLMYSFGGLRRSGEADSGLLPPGIGESDLLGISIGPDLDSTTVQACLKELREQCLYLHFDGVRYCFKRDPNVTLLVEQEADAVARDESRVRARIKAMIEERLAGQRSAIVWPAKSADVPDRETQFLIAYLPLEFTAGTAAEQQEAMKDICEHHGNRAREFRNGLGLVVPSGDQVEVLRRAVRYLLAVERVRDKWREHNLTDAQKSQLKEREATERAAAESALLKLYGEIRLPETDGGSLSLDTIGMGGRPLQTTLDEKKRALIHQRLMELLTTVQRRIFGTVAPGKIVELFRLGEDDSAEPGISTARVVAGFFSFLGFPRLLSGDVVRKAIARGVETGLFACTTGRPELGDDGRYQVDWSRIAFRRAVTDDEIDLDSGFLIVPSALPEKIVPTTNASLGGVEVKYPPIETGGEPLKVAEIREDQRPTIETAGNISFSFTADRDTLYAATAVP